MDQIFKTLSWFGRDFREPLQPEKPEPNFNGREPVFKKIVFPSSFRKSTERVLIYNRMVDRTKHTTLRDGGPFYMCSISHFPSWMVINHAPSFTEERWRKLCLPLGKKYRSEGEWGQDLLCGNNFAEEEEEGRFPKCSLRGTAFGLGFLLSTSSPQVVSPSKESGWDQAAVRHQAFSCSANESILQGCASASLWWARWFTKLISPPF